MREKEMIKTKVRLVTGFYIEVQEPVDEVKELVEESVEDWFIILTLENGNPFYLKRKYIVGFTEC